MERERETIYDENLRLHRTAKQLEMVSNYVACMLKYDNYPTIDRGLCVLLDLDYDEIMAERGDK